ncbi:GFA family protein [Paracoccus sp. MBLB3053]|uniref:GFA family protein n=1 Tax=Paracoccus aurantius TaxID=3073814 RepID=A0ABU2HRE0_9RHOB|nr:GFA family protein [Paracoccus sp. MBLB3053]MDS9467130.1 GFA family protein [Paracoccus sp. MBLB3053]
MSDRYSVSCDCGSVEMVLIGEPRVRGHCHCQDCRTLLDIPYHSVTAWNPDQVEIARGHDLLSQFRHPRLSMKKVFCSNCGEVIYNTNAMDWRVVSQHLIAKNYGNTLPDTLRSMSHFHYASRLIDVADDLPKKP